MHKILLLLGLLRRRPYYGYELHRVVRAHGELYTDLKKGNLYYLLDRLAREGDLQVQTEGGARGARGERFIYKLTEQGRSRFETLLRETLLTYEPGSLAVGAAIVFLTQLPPAEGLTLLEKRYDLVMARRVQAIAEQGDSSICGPLVSLADDHLIGLIDAELAWIDRSLTSLREQGWIQPPGDHSCLSTAQDGE